MKTTDEGVAELRALTAVAEPAVTIEDCRVIDDARELLAGVTAGNYRLVRAWWNTRTSTAVGFPPRCGCGEECSHGWVQLYRRETM